MENKGYLYEVQIKNHININMNKKAYLWNETPEDLLIKYKIIDSHNQARIIRKENKLNPLRDTGVDIVMIDNNNKISFVQCKNGYEKGIIFNDLAGISLWTLTHYDLISKSYIYYTNKLSNNITLLPSTKKLEFIKLPYGLEKKQEVKQEIKPYDYQTEALKKFVEYYKNNDRGILSLPCGTGKTYTSYLISKSYIYYTNKL